MLPYPAGSRRALIDRLPADTHHTLSIVAPIGYGKTTVAAAWSAATGWPRAWVSLEADCSEPTTLLDALAAALASVCPVDPTVLHEPTPTTLLLDALGDAMAAAPEPFVLVLDDMHTIAETSGHEAALEVLSAVPAGCAAVVTSQGAWRPPVTDAGGGGWTELDADDLRLDASQIGLLLREAHVDGFSDTDIDDLARVTEGWAAGCSLAALTVRAGAPWNPDAFGGGDRFVVDYLRETVLRHLPRDQELFLVHTSLLDELSGPICDAVLEGHGSAAMLAALASANLFVLGLDDRGERYRYHGLFRDALQHELRHREPDLVTVLSTRASRWFESQGATDLAFEHAMTGHDVDRVAELFTRYAQLAYTDGRSSTVARWLRWLDEHGEHARYPAVAVMATMFMIMEGHPHDADRWADAAEAAARRHPLPPELEAPRSLAAAMMCRNGVDQMLADGATAVSLLPVSNPWRTTATAVTGLASLLTDRSDEAIELFRQTATEAAGLQTWVGEAVANAELAICALRVRDTQTAVDRAHIARQAIEAHRLSGYASSALVFAVSARVALHQGDPARAAAYVRAADDLRSGMTAAMPTLAVQLRLELARCALALDDIHSAQTYLAEASAIKMERPGLGILLNEMLEVQAEMDAQVEGRRRAPHLTPAELRLLPLLTTHHSFAEIAEQLSISPHTVKTQAISIYRKLDVTSRSEAVARARIDGLLED